MANRNNAGLRAIVLGSAAGGGVPQWNCGCRICERARSGDPLVLVRNQTSLAVSSNGEGWIVFGAPPDLRQQVLKTPVLRPRGPRHSPISDVVLLNADVDGVGGLLVLREGQPFRLCAPPTIHAVLNANPLFRALDPGLVERIVMWPGEPMMMADGTSVTLIEMPGKPPLYLDQADTGESFTFAARIVRNRGCLMFVPACAAITEPVLDLLAQAGVIFFDGTLFTDEEMIHAGLSVKTGRDMGHVSMSGPEGSIARLAKLPVRRIFIHINNSNPVLIEGSPERRQAELAGFEVAFDGMEVQL